MAYAYDRELAPWAPALPPVDLRYPAEARERVRKVGRVRSHRTPGAASDGLRITDRTVPGPEGAPAVPVRVYEPAVHALVAPPPRPTVLYFHGGGFVTGDLETGHEECLWIAAALGVVIINVDYRLAPECPYPNALMDAHAVLYWAWAEADSLGIDRDRIALAGEDAGAGIAAALALLVKDRRGVRPCFQLLTNPLLDDRLETHSAHTCVDTPVLDRTQAAHSWFHYLGPHAGQPEVSPYSAPARAEDLQGLPAAYLAVCEYDPVRDEAITYAQRLLQAGVTTELHHYPGTFHDCASIPGTDITLRMRENRLYALSRALFTPPEEQSVRPHQSSGTNPESMEPVPTGGR